MTEPISRDTQNASPNSTSSPKDERAEDAMATVKAELAAIEEKLVRDDEGEGNATLKDEKGQEENLREYLHDPGEDKAEARSCWTPTGPLDDPYLTYIYCGQQKDQNRGRKNSGEAMGSWDVPGSPPRLSGPAPGKSTGQMTLRRETPIAPDPEVIARKYLLSQYGTQCLTSPRVTNQLSFSVPSLPCFRHKILQPPKFFTATGYEKAKADEIMSQMDEIERALTYGGTWNYKCLWSDFLRGATIKPCTGTPKSLTDLPPEILIHIFKVSYPWGRTEVRKTIEDSRTEDDSQVLLPIWFLIKSDLDLMRASRTCRKFYDATQSIMEIFQRRVDEQKQNYVLETWPDVIRMHMDQERELCKDSLGTSKKAWGS